MALLAARFYTLPAGMASEHLKRTWSDTIATLARRHDYSWKGMPLLRQARRGPAADRAGAGDPHRARQPVDGPARAGGREGPNVARAVEGRSTRGTTSRWVLEPSSPRRPRPWSPRVPTLPSSSALAWLGDRLEESAPQIAGGRALPPIEQDPHYEPVARTGRD